MRVSFGPTSSLGSAVKSESSNRSSLQYDSRVESTDRDHENQEEMDTEDRELIRQLRKEREDAFKREEALRDRIKLQESICNKQIQELRAQIKKMTIDNQRVPKSRESISIPGGMKSERKREGKTKEVRELVKTIDSLKAENHALQTRVQKLSEFVKVAGDLKAAAISRCASKDEIIQSLQGELRVVENLYDNESQRRLQVESEIMSLRTYIDLTRHKNREKTRNKMTQTDTSIPARFSLGCIGSSSYGEFLPSNTASFASLSAAASSLKIKNIAEDYKEETRTMRRKFNDEVREKKDIGLIRRSKSEPRINAVQADGHVKNEHRKVSGSKVHKSKLSSTRREESHKPGKNIPKETKKTIRVHRDTKRNQN